MPQLDQLIADAEQAITHGNVLTGLSLLRQAARLNPSHTYASTRLADLLIDQQQFDEAEAILQTVISATPAYSPAHLLTGRIAAQRADYDLAIQAFDRAILHDNAAWGARVEKARLLEALTRHREASLCWAEAIRSMPDYLREAQHMQGLVEHARQVVTANHANLEEALMIQLAPLMSGESKADLQRFQHAFDIITGRRQFVTANPLFLPIPRLPAIPYFDRSEFPWAASIEEATGDIRNELRQVMQDAESDFIPYVQTREGSSSGQFAPLDNNSAWSAYFLWKHGTRIDSHCERCPTTTQAIENAPLPRIRARAPAAFFSRLDAGTHIPPHNGATNARLTVHLPLIVPKGCAFRVGDETREWNEGELLIFDDTILHEAWNGSDRQRFVLIFDIWHPMLTQIERELVTRTVEGLVDYYGNATELGEL